MKTTKIGNLGESAVCRYLEARGYKILDRNYRIRGGELDIVAEHCDELCFVEVKTRRIGSMGSGDEAVDRRKQERIIRTAYRWCETHEIDETRYIIRYDIAVVDLLNGVVMDIDYLENAFDESGFSW